MKKVLFVYHVSTVGGGSFCLLNILKNLDKYRIQPFVLLKQSGPLVDEINKLNIPVYFLKNICTVPYNRGLAHLQSLKAIYKIQSSKRAFKLILSEIQPDIVYLNTMMLYPYLYTAKNLGFKTFIHIREHWPEKEHVKQRDYALKCIAKYCDHIIAINRYSASMVVPYGRKATIIYDWIDLSSRFTYLPLDNIFGEDLSGKKVLLYTGGLQEIKGVYEVFKAFSSNVKGDDYRLLALGVPTEIRYVGLKKLIKKLLNIFRVRTYVDKVLAIANSDRRIKCIPSIYNLSHLYRQVYCMISYFTIPHANLSLAEAVISKTFTISAMTDESLEYTKEGRLGLLYELNNYSEFEIKLGLLDKLRSNYLTELEQHSYEVERMFNPDINISKLNNLLIYEVDSNL